MEKKSNKERRQALFLKACEEWGTVGAACATASVPRDTYYGWIKERGKFSNDMDLARQNFAEQIEELALQRIRNPDKNRGSDVLLIALLNANMPAKYRPQSVMSEDSAKELIMEWRKVAKDGKKDEEVVGEELPANIQDTLADILAKRKDAPPQDDDYGSITEKDIAWG